MTNFRDIGALVSSYYKEPDVAFEEIKKELEKMEKPEE